MSNAQLAENQARLNVSLQDIITFFDEADCPPSSLQKLSTLLEAHDYVRLLELIEGFVQCMAFIDHDLIVKKMSASWNLLYEGIVIERKIISKKLRVLEADKNSDPDVILKLQTSKGNIDRRKAKATVACAKLSYMARFPLETFIQDPNFEVNQKELLRENIKK
jgi:hypothetical protein